MSGRHYCSYFVARDAVIITKIRFSQVFDCDVAAVYVMATFG